MDALVVMVMLVKYCCEVGIAISAVGIEVGMETSKSQPPADTAMGTHVGISSHSLAGAANGLHSGSPAALCMQLLHGKGDLRDAVG